MDDDANLIIEGIKLLLPVVVLAVCYITGRMVEKRHFQRLEVAESELAGILTSTQRYFPPNWKSSGSGELVAGSVVIATDHFKVVVSWFQSLFGGNLKEFERLLERARREAMVRMLRQAQLRGANVVWNVRLETVFMGDQKRKRPTGAEIVVYGTAYMVQ